VALPQLGVAKRVIVFDLGGGPFFVLNPVVGWRSDEKFEVWDDCMCMPSIAVRVLRARVADALVLDETMHRRRLARVSPEISTVARWR
jgi:peptide deformylase